MREKIKKEGNFPVLILKFNTAWYLIIILWHLCPWVNLHNRLWQILPDQSVLPRSWTLEGSAALWFWKGHALQRPGTEGVTAVAEPQQTDHLAARVDKGAPEAWQETHKHWYLPGGGGGIVGYNLHKHQILLVQQQTHAHSHPHIPNYPTLPAVLSPVPAMLGTTWLGR